MIEFSSIPSILRHFRQGSLQLIGGDYFGGYRRQLEIDTSNYFRYWKLRLMSVNYTKFMIWCHKIDSNRFFNIKSIFTMTLKILMDVLLPQARRCFHCSNRTFNIDFDFYFPYLVFYVSHFQIKENELAASVMSFYYFLLFVT